MRLISVLTVSLAAAAAAFAANAQSERPASSGVFSKAQAERGAALYAEKCSACHGEALGGSDVNPPLSGPRFLGNWKGQPVSALSTRIRTSMPATEPGSLGLAATTDLVAHILEFNGYPAGAADMPTGSSAQGGLMIDGPPAR